MSAPLSSAHLLELAASLSFAFAAVVLGGAAFYLARPGMDRATLFLVAILAAVLAAYPFIGGFHVQSRL